MATKKREIAEKTCQMDKWFIEYATAHPEILDLIPKGAIIVFQDPDDPYFNEASRRLALDGQARDITAGEGKKPLVYITIRMTPERRTVMVPQVEILPEVPMPFAEGDL